MSLASKFKWIKAPYLIVLIGPPLSGKSFFCKRFKNDIDDAVRIINRDEIVMDVWGSDNYTEAFKNVNQKEVNRILQSKFLEASQSNDNIIIDMTNTSKKRRGGILELFKNHYKIAVTFPILDNKIYVERNDFRNLNENKNIPMSVVRDMIDNLDYPVKSEGFNKIIDLDIKDITS